jgi:hypothetical protein
MVMETTKCESNYNRREYGILARQRFLSMAKGLWGNYESENLYLYKFANGNKILTLFASLSNQDRWWYGVSDTYWLNLDERTSMALLMRWEGTECSFILLNPKISQKILSNIGPTSGNIKRINIRIPSTGKIYAQEWPDLPLRVYPLEKIEQPTTPDWKSTYSQTVPRRRTFDAYLAIKKRISKMTTEERQALIKELREMV